MTEKPKWEKTWDELSREEKTPCEWERRTQKFCPFSRKPCEEKIDPKGKDIPENFRMCNFFNSEYEKCKFETFLEGFEDFSSLVEVMGVFLYKEIFGTLPKLEKKPRFWNWMI